MSDDPVFTIRDAAAYCRVRPFSVRRALYASGVWFEVMASQSRYGPRVIQGVRKSTLDRLMAAGFLISRPGRRARGRMLRDVFREARS